jgi:hypothetical protein
LHREKATLPTFGTVAVDFHSESETIALLFSEQKEWDRLRTVPHLGVAASVFSGVHHSRLEYVLLQCAVTALVGKLHRHDEQFALSNNVDLAGISRPISSGEELLKIWILLSNYGHAQYTYGVERSLLQQAMEDPDVKEWLTRSIWPADLRRWAINTIDAHRYPDFRYVLTLLRMSLLPAGDRRKRLVARYLRNLLLPVNDLLPTAPAARYKLARLRQLFRTVRLLSMVALDAHYSHHPISLNINSAVIGLADLLSTTVGQQGFNELINGMAGWLADELYLHPSALAAQKEYELRFDTRFPRRFRDARRDRRLPTLVQELMTQGLGPPRGHRLVHLVRLTFPAGRRRLLDPEKNLYETQKYLATHVLTQYTNLAVNFNGFTESLHLDFYYWRDAGTVADMLRVYTRLQKWLLRSVEAEALTRIRRIYLGKEDRPRARERELSFRVQRYAFVFQSVFDSLIRLILPVNYRGVISEFKAYAGSTASVLARLRFEDGTIVDTATSRLEQALTANSEGHPPERLQEIRCLKYAMEMVADAPCVLICPEKFIVRDEFGRFKDDWDGIVFAISDTRVRLIIVEGKTGGTIHEREEGAFNQLDQTRKLLQKRYPLTYRRSRIPRMGAMLDLALL